MTQRVTLTCLLLVTFLLGNRLFAARIECVAGCGEGPETHARGVKLVEPFGVAFDTNGNWYVCEHKGERIVRIDRAGKASVFAATGSAGYSGDGGPASQAAFFDPHGVAVSRDQQLYVADTRNHCIRRIDLRTLRITTLAGTGEAGFSGDGGAASRARFNGAFAVDIDRKNRTLYVADLANYRIRRIDLRTGIVTTAAGNGEKGIPEDGTDAEKAPLFDPRAVAVDSKGLLYILERGGNALRVVDQKGKIRTLIGPTRGSEGGSKETPNLNGPKHLCLDRKDRVVIADAENHLVRLYDPKTGKTTVIAGSGDKGSQVVPDNPLKTQLSRPHGVFVHASGALYISDSYNHRILKMTAW